nr:acyl-CoA dehydrogenase family protein [Sinimarinibacterium sp. CAU 1509]
MSLTSNAMGLGLRALNRLAGLPLVDKLGLRRTTERAMYTGARVGFRAAGAVGRSFKATQTLLKPARLAGAPSRSLFDLTPDDDQVMLREAVLSYAQEQLRPAAAAADAATSAPDELLTAAAELGIAQLGIPESLGGAGAQRNAVTNVLIAEAMAQGDLSLAVACLAPSAVSNALVLWGNPEQQATYLPAFAGEHTPGAALAILEPQPLFDPLALRARARAVGGGFVLDGVKSLVPRAASAELFIIAAELEGRGPALFLVESSSAGLSIEAEPAMGLRAASTARVHLQGVQLPATALIADADAQVYRDCLNLGRLGWCALSVGTAQAALDYVIPYVNERTAFGEPISHRQSVAFAVANIGIELEGMRLTTLRAASRAEQGLAFSQQTAVARRLCIEKGVQIGSDAVQLLGGHGFVKEHPVERWYRDLRAAGVVEGVLLV